MKMRSCLGTLEYRHAVQIDAQESKVAAIHEGVLTPVRTR